MKNIFINLLSFVLLMIFCLRSAAQNIDSLSNNKRIKDSIFQIANQGHYVSDSMYKEEAVRVVKGFRKDSLIHVQGKLRDSLRKKELFTANAHYSNYAKATTGKAKTDSLHKTRTLFSKKTDSLQKLNKVTAVKFDSLRKIYALNVKLDSLHKYNSFQLKTSDSLRKKIYLQKIKTDSQRIKLYLQQKKIELQNFSKDTVVIKQGLGSRKLSMEITCNQGDTVYINNYYRKLAIKTIPSQKLRLSTTYYYKEASNERDDKIFQKMGIELSRANSSVTAMIKDTKQSRIKNTDELCVEEKIMENNANKTLVIEIPVNSIIVINNKYAKVRIENFVINLNADILNGSLRMENADHVVIKSNYATIKAGDIKNADLNLSSTDFTASNIVSMSVVSNSSTIKLDKCISMNMASTGDNYNIDKASSISGNKNFGKLQIENLKDQLILTGASADIKIDNISYEAPFIKIDNKYADLKLPLYNQQNYAVYYEGSYNDVNKLSTATQKLNGLGNITARLSVASDTLAGIGSQANVNVNVNINKTRFEAVAGNISGKHTKIDIVCPFCNVAFN